VIKAHTLGLAGQLPSVIVDVFGMRAPGRGSIEGCGIAIEAGTQDRVEAALRQIGIRADGVDVDLRGFGAKVIPGSADLAIAAVIAGVESNQEGGAMPGRLAECILLGELGPQGELVPVRGILSMLLGLGRDLTAIVPSENGLQAARAGAGERVLVADSLQEVLAHLAGTRAPLRSARSGNAPVRAARDPRRWKMPSRGVG
jgi:predicted ATPase with chaperone activity